MGHPNAPEYAPPDVSGAEGEGLEMSDFRDPIRRLEDATRGLAERRGWFRSPPARDLTEAIVLFWKYAAEDCPSRVQVDELERVHGLEGEK